LWAIGLASLFWLGTITVAAQDSSTYTVQPGDTLGQIAARLNVDLEALAAANNITNINMIDVGQVLLIPGAQQSLPRVISRPGDTLESIAQRWDIPAEQLAALNELDPSTRLFPGQPVSLSESASLSQSLRLGAVTAFHYPQQLIQGKTGWLTVTSRRPVSITLAWNSMPLPLATYPTQDGGTIYTAHIPVPALLGPGQFPLDLIYTARSGVSISRTFPIAVVDGGYPSQQINLPPDRGALLAPEITQAELITVTAAWSATDTPIQWPGTFQRPLSADYPTTSAYGIRRSYDGGPYSSYHAGQDFGAPVGVTVTVPAAGIVALAQPLQVRGNAVIIDHGQGVFSGYWHLSQIFVEPGQKVETGDLLGLVGNTGLSTGAHLHWELRIYGLAVDPLQFLTEPLFPPIEARAGG
jgi:murein DD-endopeptidase MepM/ murein hydrolase activator NlpD